MWRAGRGGGAGGGARGGVVVVGEVDFLKSPGASVKELNLGSAVLSCKEIGFILPINSTNAF